MYRRILIPLDGSRHAEAVFTQLHPLLVVSGARPILLGAIRSQDEHVSAREYLDGVRARLLDCGAHARVDVRRGRPAEAILEACHKYEADLIAMASHGHTGLERLVFGSTTERLLRQSRVPLLVVKSDVRRPGPADVGAALPMAAMTWRDVLVPLDGSVNSEQALGPALDMAGIACGRLHLLHAVPPVPMTSFGGQAQRLRNASDPPDYLPKLAAELAGSAAEVRTATVEGATLQSIERYIADHGISLVVMTTHGRSGLGRFLLGSFAETVLRTVNTPILLHRITGDSLDLSEPVSSPQ